MWSDAIDRYRTPIADIFSAENKLQYQLHIEAMLAQVQSNMGMIEEKVAKQISEATKSVRLERVKEIESEIHHDLMAVVKALAEQAGNAGTHVHFGATSNDIQDTTLALQLVEAKEVLLDLFDEVSNLLASLARKYQMLACIGRTHGQFAVPTTVGFKFANFLYELQLAKEAVFDTQVNISKFSGAVGNYASTKTMEIEQELLKALNLKPAKISTQVVSRVVHAKFMSALALVAGVMERLSKEIRHLQRSEISEWFEPFSEKQVGSSAMPHKRNPHKSERISGLSRIIRGNTSVSLENIALEHERDISHSSVERIIIPESCNLLYFIGEQMRTILDGLIVDKKRINKNIRLSSDVSKSEQILKELVPHTGRQRGHEILRKHATSEDYRYAVMNDEQILKHISKEKLESIFEEVDVGLSGQKVQQILDIHLSHWIKYRD